MKIDRSKLKKSTTDVPADCRPLIDRLKNATSETLLTELTALKQSTFGKCELYHWADVLDVFDDVLEKACKKEQEKSWTLACDIPTNEELKTLLLHVLGFTSTLIEHSFSRHLYNSMEHLTTLLQSCDMKVVLEVLNLLYVFSKRSNFITRLSNDKKQGLVTRLTHLAESWGGKDNGFGLAECCQNQPITEFPSSATTLHFEFYHENTEDKLSKKGISNTITSIHIDGVDQYKQLPTQIMEDLVTKYKIPEEKQVLLYTHIRLAYLFSKYESRAQCVQARLQSIAILVYSNAIQENINSLLYPGFIEELVDIVELKDDNLVEIKSAALRTLTSIIHLERNPKLNNIIDATGAASYHGFLPLLVRNCIHHMTDTDLKPFPQPYATALFSFLYHLASYENGVEALVSCGMMETLLKVINWFGEGHDHITFATRAVRVVDLITNLDMAAFQTQGGLAAFINRLEHEVGLCRLEQPFEIRPNRMNSSLDSQPESPPLAMEIDTALSPSSDKAAKSPSHSEQEDQVSQEPQPSTSSGITDPGQEPLPDYSAAKTNKQCFPQRAALMKSMLNFLKKAIPDPSFSESMRHLMEGSLPKSLKHIISNAEYYGPSLFLLATDVVTVYVFQEPSLLSSLQDNGLTNVVLHALLIKDVPATREVLASLPNVFSALCLNARGLEAFVLCRPFDRLFKVLLSPDYLPAMRRRRSADPFGDTASNLGNAMDELMRHQPSLRTDATKAIIKLLQEVNFMGQDKKYICQKPQPKSETVVNLRSPQAQDGGSSDEEEEDEEIGTSPQETQDSESKQASQMSTDVNLASTSASSQDKQAIPLMDYVLNVMKFVEAILSNNSTDDHCREFVAQKGLPELMDILGLPNLPVEFPASPACQAVASVCKAILTLLRDPRVLEEGLEKLNGVLEKLEPLHQPLESPGGSVLLHELASVAHLPDATLSPHATPLLHALSSAHAYIMMFVHVCRMGQTDIRSISVNHWGSELGRKVLDGLSKLYTSLVWESTILLALCSEDILPAECEFGKADMEKLLPKDFKLENDFKEEDNGLSRSAAEKGSNGVSQAMESLTTSDTPITMDTEDGSGFDKDGKKPKISPALQAQMKQLKPLLSVSSRLGRALAELFGLLVKLSVGTRVRQRGSQMLPSMPVVPTQAAQSVAQALTNLLTEGLKWEPPAYSPVPKLRLTFLVCSVGFASPMLFDDKKQPYHLMLQKFLGSGGMEALFKSFTWALSIDGKVSPSEGLEDPDLPSGTGELLDAWLMLIEKMVNPKTVLESPHQLPAKSGHAGFQSFDPVPYLIRMQKDAFYAVMNLWNKKPLKVYGSRMSESILAILCHIIKGEGIIRQMLAQTDKEKDGAGAAGPSGSSTGGASVAGGLSEATAASLRPPVNDSHVQQLMEMGFSRTRCLEALTHTQTIEEATDYLLTRGSDFTPPVQGVPGLDMDLSEDQQMLQAIAMSLGQDMIQSEKEDQKKIEAVKTGVNVDEVPLDKSFLDEFTDKLFPGCLALLDTLPETVYRACELLTVVTQRNGLPWQNMVLSTLVEEVKSLSKSILSLSVPSESTNNLAQTEAAKFASRIHLFSLLFEETMIPCAEAVENNNLTDLLVQVMSAGKDYLLAVKNANTPKWLAPLLLLLDLYEKVSVISKRKADAEKTLANCHTWKWFDDTSGRWCKYSTGNNKTIDDAYQAGETSVRFTAGRRRYTVHFNSMVQINEETANRRPIMLTCPSPTELKQSNEKKEDNNSQTSQSPDSKMDTDQSTPSTNEVMGLQDHELKWLTNHLGHTAKVHLTHYRATSGLIERLDIAKIMLLQEKNSVGKFSGKKLSEIQFQDLDGETQSLVEDIQDRELNEEVEFLNGTDEADEVPFRGKKKAKTVTRVKWTEDEEKEIEEYFKEFLDGSKKCPRREDCLHAISLSKCSGGQLAKRHWETIKKKVHHMAAKTNSIVSMIAAPVEADTLHAALRLILRLTREHKYALQFAELGGPRILLSLTQASAFQGFLSLTTLIFRHILEEPASLKYCMEKVIRSVCSGSGSSLSGVSQRSIGAKEMHYVLRVLTPTACRNPHLFKDLTKEKVRILLPPPSKRDEDESRFTGPNAPQILKCLSTQQVSLPTLQSPIKDVIESLLDSLIVKFVDSSDEGTGTGSEGLSAKTLIEAIIEATIETTERQSEILRQNSTAEILQSDDDQQAGGSILDSTKTKFAFKDGKTKEEKQSQRPLLPKSAILRMLSEIIKSYSNCTLLITQYMYHAGQSELVQEDCSVLAFVLDHLLHQNSNVGDRDCPALSRVFIASIATCNHSPEAQLTLVNEVKSALQRALTLPESPDKHSRIHALTSIISTMIESCPSQGQLPNQVFKGQQNIMNNIVKNLLKRGLVTDLARIPYSLDLSSPYVAATINAVLKPLETLSRSVNQPVPNANSKPKQKSDGDTDTTVTTITNTQGATPAEPAQVEGNEVQIEEILNTSHQVNEDLEETHHETVEEPLTERSELDDVLNSLIGRDRNQDPESQVIGEIIMETEQSHVGVEEPDVLVDVELEEGEIDDHHDSQMISQLISEGEDDDIDHTQNITDQLHDDDETADSASDADDDDNDDDDGDDDDEDDDDEDDEDQDADNEEDDEGSDMEADNEDYQIENRPFNDTFVIHADEIFSSGPSQPHVVFNALDGGQVRPLQSITYHDNDNNANETSAPNIPPVPSNVTITHPLLVRQADAQNIGTVRGQRGRQRSTCRFNPSTQMLHVNLPRQPNPPVILQRLLGPSTAADVLQLTNTLNTQAGPTHTRVVLSNNDLRIISRPEEEILEELFQDSFPDTGSSMGMGTLSTIPSTLNRWTEEAKVLDGDSLHDCMAALKPEIIEKLEKERDEELADRREKRKKTTEEEEAKKADTQKKAADSNAEQKMEVSPTTVIQDLSLSMPGPIDVSSIPLPTSSTTAITPTTTSAGHISAAEAAAAAQGMAERTAEVLIEQMVEEGLASSGLPSIPSSNTSSGNQPSTGGFQAMPPLTIPVTPLATPDVVPTESLFSRLQSFTNTAGQDTSTPITVIPPSTAQIYAPPNLPPPMPSFPENIQVPESVATRSITTPASASNVLQNRAPFANIGISQIATPVLQTPGNNESNAPYVPVYTPDNQGIPTLTPQAPRVNQNPGSNNQRDIFQSYLQSVNFADPVSSESIDESTSHPIGSLVSLLLNDSQARPDQAQPPLNIDNMVRPGETISFLRQNLDSSVVTPEEVSNITSSDAATVHSSTSESPQEINTDRTMANLVSVTEGAAPVTTSTAVISSSEAQTSQPVAGSSTTDSSGSQEQSGVPEGLDPSFLAALPENIRAEVIADHLRMQRIQQRRQEQQNTETPGGLEVNAEFLAALPPAIQEEVLAQQRIEQERLAAQTNATANPDAPVDPASFFATLPSSLRQSVLADMDDSVMAVLPADLAAEAQSLRRELEDRHRRIMHERLFTQQAPGGSLSSILRHAGVNLLQSSLRCALGRGPRSDQNWGFGKENYLSLENPVKVRGRHLLDHEALTCLLVLLFVDEPKLNTGRLHRVLRNLCYHGPTRTWVIRSLLSILSRTGDNKVDVEERTRTPDKGKAKKLQSQQPMQTDTPSGSSRVEARSQGSWLSISLEAALGCRANVFQLYRTAGKKHSSTGNAFVTIHPQASPVVCRHVLDALISLAKMFPNQFLPSKAKEVQKCDNDKEKESDSKSKTSVVSDKGSANAVQKAKHVDRQDSKSDKIDTDFWELLVKLDTMCNSKKGKGIQRTHSNVSNEQETGYKDYDTAPLGQLMAMLSHPVIKRSQLLTDRLLRLLQLISSRLLDSDRQTASGTSSTYRPATADTVFSRIYIPPRAVSGANVSNRGTNTADLNQTPASQKEDSKKDKVEPEKKDDVKKEEEPAILENQLQLAVQVLTSKSCSEEGLEDATSLLLQLSWANKATCRTVLHLLLTGARELGTTVCQHIRTLLEELKSLNLKLSPDGDIDENKDLESVASQQKGLLTDRYTGTNVVVTTPKKLKSGRELQLASMSVLTSKASSQQFFLRILKVIIQLRDAARSANTATFRKPKGLTSRPRDFGEAMAMIEAEADSLMQFVSSRENRRMPPAVEINIQEEDLNTPDSPHVPPVIHSAVGLAEPQNTAQNDTSGTDVQSTEQSEESPMETDKPGTSTESEENKEETEVQLPRLSEEIDLEELWHILGDCLSELDQTPDHHAVLILQPAVEAFFLVHAGEKDSKDKDSKQSKREDQFAHLNIEMPASPQPSTSETGSALSRENSVQASSSTSNINADTEKFLKFAETHRTVLNQILRQSTTPLADGPFAVLVDHTRILDFDVKRRYFRQELEKLDEGMRREDLAVHVRREHVFEDSFRELFRRTADEWKHRFYIVFEGEDGQDAGGLLREWYIIIAREIFNPNYALFCISPGDRVTYTINALSNCNSNHLSYFKFVGRIIAKAIFDNKLMDCYFTRSFYKHIIGAHVKYTDMESEDYTFYMGLVFLLENNVKDLGYELTMSTEIQEFGINKVVDLIPNGRNILVMEETKYEYVKQVCQMKMTGSIRQQLHAFLEGFYDIIPKQLISIFNEQELELLISGLPTIDIEDLKSNTEYHKYQPNSLQVLWFWRALRSFDQADRARFLQFVTGTSKVPLQGFAHLEGMNGTQKFQIHRDDRSTDRLPAAHTCFNQLDLPAYETYDKLRHMLLLAINECSEGFGLA